ncbi:MAG TPA: hypothetical protein VFL27_12855 [Candidatus Dormibacteraeota bacterium]|nr:hypothetical protein [Candidatus Dormibacteraeota bacterium]
MDPYGTLHWDSLGPFRYDVGYDAAVAAHNGSQVVAAYLVTDSGWEGLPYTNSITNVSYGGNTYATTH